MPDNELLRYTHVENKRIPNKFRVIEGTRYRLERILKKLFLP